MEKEKHLKPYQHYADLYDRHTVERCRTAEQPLKDEDVESLDEKVTKEEVVGVKKAVHQLYMHFMTGERYLNRESQIRGWMDADQKKDDLYESAQAPEDMRCLTCRNRLKPTSKMLWTETDKEDRVLFMYDCPNQCLPRRSFFSDGEEWRHKPDPCPNCDGILKHESKDDEKKMITVTTCTKCEYSKTDEYEWKHKKEDDFDPNFATDRDRFCLTKEEGEKFRDEKFNMQQMAKLMEEWKKEDEEKAKKLAENPQGFRLDGAGYSCHVCGNGTPEGDNWYDAHGIKCLVCQKAIDEGEIPATVASDKDSWYSKYDFEKFFNVKSPTLRKWVRQGIVKSRDITHYGKGSHYQLFLIEDNMDFLPPKKMLESKRGHTQEEGVANSHMYPWYRFVDARKYLKDYKIMDHLRVTEGEETK